MTQNIALITGASGGIATALAERLGEQGWQLALVSRQASAVADTRDRVWIQADVSTAEGAQTAVHTCLEKLGRPRALVNCAGSTLLLPLHRTTEADFRNCLGANLDTAFFTLQAFVEAVRSAGDEDAGESPDFRAVLMSSVVAQVGVVNHEAISAGKAAIEGLVRAAAATYAPWLRINAVAPGLVATKATARILASEAGRRAAARQYPLGRYGSPADVAGLIAWLVGPEASWVSGQVWQVDGAFTGTRPMVR